jgi:RNase H-like domain found in reverse transcriptase/Integrase zinc binding domain
MKSLQTDASGYAISGTISQPTNNEGRWKPILFYSRKLTPAEMNYTTPDKEMLAIVQMFKKYQHYLRETKYLVVVKTDHRNLTYFMTTKELNARQARWAEELTKYNFRIEHVKGKENVVADALSRRPDSEEKPSREKAIFKMDGQSLIINEKADLGMVVNDEEELLKKIKDNPDEQCRKGTQNQQGLWMFKNAVIVPKRLEKPVIEDCHDGLLQGHFGEARTVEKIQRRYYFPGMIRKVQTYIRGCEDCQKNREDHHRPYGKMQLWQYELEKPWQHIAMDFMME